MFPHHRSCAHAVLFYKDEGSLRDSVSGYIGAALRAGEPALVIAKPALLQQVRIELHRQHVQSAPFGPDRGSFVALDAEDTLRRICVGGSPDEALFQNVVGGALERLSEPGKQVAAYGEMVGLLCERGRYADAIQLEALWNDLLARSKATLYCGYARQLFDAPVGRPFYEKIRAAHSTSFEDERATA
jgi:hypothetical protein